MKVEPIRITVRDLTEGYQDDGEAGVSGYGGMLDIRPPYQREFVYDEDQRAAVIGTLRRGFPLNAMYWAMRGSGDYEVVDGQQRSISICQYVDGAFSIDGLSFGNLTDEEQEQILDYELMIYLCEGTDRQKLDWFELVNIAGEELTRQELRNAVYAGPWVSDAKRYFSKKGCVAYRKGSKYLTGSAIRQDYLETAIKWVSDDIEDHMGIQQHTPSAEKLWRHFQSVISWVQATFTTYRKEMKGIDWGTLYASFKDADLAPDKLEAEVARLMEDDDVTNKKGIYFYVLDGKESHLNIRAFTQAQKRQAYERQKGVCPACSKRFDIDDMEADHIDPWHDGGPTSAENCQMLCKPDNRRKAGK